MFGYEHSISVGANVLECDARATADGFLVCIHDDTVDRTTDGTGLVSELTFEEIRALDAGYNFTLDEGETFPHRGSGVQIATLEELIQTYPEMYFAIELKQRDPSIVDTMVSLIEANNVADRVVMASFYDSETTAFRCALPNVVSALNLAELNAFALLATDDDNFEAQGQIIQAPDDPSILTVEKVEQAHRLGLRVHVWTVNEREDMERLIGMGVDGFFTDNPELLSTVLSEQ